MPERILVYLLVAIATYYWSTLVQVVFHRAFGHRKRIPKIYRTHVGGHHAQYAKGPLVRDRFEDPEREVAHYFFIPILPVALAGFVFFSWDVVCVHLLTIVVSYRLHFYVHEQYHLSGSWLNRFSWFRRKQQLHLVHHRRPNRNFAIIEFFWDRLFGTLVRDCVDGKGGVRGGAETATNRTTAA